MGRSKVIGAELLKVTPELLTDTNDVRTPLGALHTDELSDIQLVDSHLVPCTTKIEEIDQGEKFLPDMVTDNAPLAGMLNGFDDRAVGAS